MTKPVFKANILEDEKLVTIGVCESSWMGLGVEKECITVTPDIGSMESFSDVGFGSNFCGENKVHMWDFVDKACFYGSIAGSIAAGFFTGGYATVLLFTIGSGAIACDKITDLQEKWPKSQYD